MEQRAQGRFIIGSIWEFIGYFVDQIVICFEHLVLLSIEQEIVYCVEVIYGYWVHWIQHYLFILARLLEVATGVDQVFEIIIQELENNIVEVLVHLVEPIDGQDSLVLVDLFNQEDWYLLRPPTNQHVSALRFLIYSVNNQLLKMVNRKELMADVVDLPLMVLFIGVENVLVVEGTPFDLPHQL